MSTLDLTKISRIHFIGIGGIGMSALARFFINEKKIVSGSDRTATPITQALEQEGIRIFTTQESSNIYPDIELFVYTEAMSHDHEEMVAAKRHGAPMINYFEALGLVANPYYLIAIAGTHGKTTTTAMLTDVFEATGKDPTAVIGSLRASTHSNYRAGKSKYAIVEACEYKRDFLHLKPDVLVITNIEYEHTDYYKDLADVQSAFRSLALQVNEGGVIVTNKKDPVIIPILAELNTRVIDYTEYLDFESKMRQPGMHVRMNAAAALAVAINEKLPETEARVALQEFAGTWRRFEYKGEFKGAIVYDDYAHHPTEIKATLAAAREAHPKQRLVAVFQPHLFSRLRSLFNDFAKSFTVADEVVIMPAYAAREDLPAGVTSRELSVKMLDFNDVVEYVDSIETTVEYLKSTLGEGDVVVVMGAGDVTKVTDKLFADD